MTAFTDNYVIRQPTLETAFICAGLGGMEQALPPQCDALCAAISVANSQNRISINYRYSG